MEKECRDILSKEKLPLSSLPNADLIEVALIALHSLSHQHLTDEAKHLYNETVIRALKEEYELISSDKNDLLEQLDSLRDKNREALQRVDAERTELKERLEELTEQYDQLITGKEADGEPLHTTVQTSSSPITEGNDWDDQILSVDVPSEETNLSSKLLNNESQTDASTHDPSATANSELERALQMSTEKIQRAMLERPELFEDANDQTIDHLIAALEKQASQIDRLNAAVPRMRFACGSQSKLTFVSLRTVSVRKKSNN